MVLAVEQTQQMQSMFAAVDELLSALTGFDPALCTGVDAARVVIELARVERLCASARVRAAARVDQCGSFRRGGHRSAGDMMADAVGVPPRVAAAALDALHALGEVPELRDAFANGELSEAQATVIAPAALANPDAAGALLDVARNGSFRRLRDDARRVRLSSFDPDELTERQRRLRMHRHWIDDDGMVAGSYRLPPQQGAVLASRIDREVDRLFRAAPKAGRESPVAYSADALYNLLAAPGAPDGGGRETRKRRRPNAKVDAIVVVDMPAILRGHVHEGERCHIVGVGPVSVTVARQMMDNAFIKGVLFDGVEIRKIRHFKRYQEAELRTALQLGEPPRFEGAQCTVGACDRRMGLQWDHIDPLANEGPTSYDNIKPKCTPHHVEKTEQDRAAGKLNRRLPRNGAAEEGGRSP